MIKVNFVVLTFIIFMLHVFISSRYILQAQVPIDNFMNVSKKQKQSKNKKTIIHIFIKIN